MSLLRKFRRLQDMLQVDLARRVSISQAKLCLIEKGYVEPDPELQKKLARALGKSRKEIFPDEGMKNASDEE